MRNLPFAVGEPFHSSAARHLGVSSRMLASAVEAGHLTKLRHGWYCRTPTAEESRAAAARRQIALGLEISAPGATASHSSAALLHGLPLVGTAITEDVHLTGTRPSGGKTSPGLITHTSPAPPDSVEVRGLRATTVSRTVIDLSRTCGFIPGVCAADAALRLGLLTRAELYDELVLHRGRVGVGTARAVADFADGLSESPGESVSRCLMSTWNEIPRPRLQHEFRDADGLFVARTDFDWGGLLVGEFDGYSKYASRGDADTDPGRVLWQEKRREDAIRALGIVVVRWVWADLRRPERLRSVLRDGLLRAGLR